MGNCVCIARNNRKINKDEYKNQSREFELNKIRKVDDINIINNNDIDSNNMNYQDRQQEGNIINIYTCIDFKDTETDPQSRYILSLIEYSLKPLHKYEVSLNTIILPKIVHKFLNINKNKYFIKNYIRIIEIEHIGIILYMARSCYICWHSMDGIYKNQDYDYWKKILVSWKGDDDIILKYIPLNHSVRFNDEYFGLQLNVLVH